MIHRAMKFFLATPVVLAVALCCCIHAASAQKAAQDPAERSAYTAAAAIKDPAERAKALQDFVRQYPDSLSKAEALAQAMAAYQQMNDNVQAGDVARQILDFDESNVRALAVVVTVDRANLTEIADMSLAGRLRAESQRGLTALAKWQRPESVSEADFPAMRNRLSATFNGALGFALLQAKDYAAARDHYRAALQAVPDDLQNTYQLGVSELEAQPTAVDGFWRVARAAALAHVQENAAATTMEEYGKAKYRAFHGGNDGWSDILAAAAKQSPPPADFAKKVLPAPPPGALAIKMADEGDPSKLSFDDWELILSFRDASPANKKAAEKVWQAIQSMQKNGAMIKIPISVYGAYGDQIDGSITEANRKADNVDAHITMRQPMSDPPDNGTHLTVLGRIVDYMPQPFSFIVKNGELAGATEP